MELGVQCSMDRYITHHASASSTNTYRCQSCSYKPPGYQGLITINSQLALKMLSILAQLSLGALASFVLWWIYRRVNTVSVSDVPGPKAESLWLGNLRQLLREEVGETDHQWRRAFGNVVRFKASFGEDRLWISDPKTIQYILNTSRYHFVKPYDARFLLNAATGNGIIGAEGESHVRMRRVLSPAFGIKESKALVPLFQESVQTLIEQLEDSIAQNPHGSYVVNIPTVVGRANLDALGKAAFEYDFGSLRGKNTELEESLHQFTAKGYGLPSNWKLFMQGIMAHAPPRLLNMMTYYPSESLEFLQRHVRLSNDISKTLLSQKQNALEEGNLGKDVLSLVVKANLSETEKHRLEDEEVIPQLSSILSAGYETTTNSIGWILFELARHPEKQRKLYDEVIRAQEAAEAQGQTELSYEEVANLPYLNAVIKETFRFDTVVPHLFRQATRDDILPLSKAIRTSSGKIVDSIPIPKGIRIVISNVGYNQDETIWGHDAGTWRPERWLDGTVERSVWNKNQALDGDTNMNLGMMNNLMSFGSGHRGCIGWRFALVETQIFLFEMIRKLNFEVTEDTKEGRVRRENCLVTQPLVEGKEVGSLPIRISAA